jgi:hypothetical protein
MSHWAEPGREEEDAGAHVEWVTMLRDLLPIEVRLPAEIDLLAAPTRWGANAFLVETRVSIFQP